MRPCPRFGCPSNLVSPSASSCLTSGATLPSHPSLHADRSPSPPLQQPRRRRSPRRTRLLAGTRH
uniref:Uncharacterized protein n=1 Tax=Arundo donax TaxID=35708 RepID=A0A0A9A4D4_ARUDO